MVKHQHKVYVWECPKCGRLWVGAWRHEQQGWPSDLMPDHYYLSEYDWQTLHTKAPHAVPNPVVYVHASSLEDTREMNTCYGQALPLEDRDEILAAYALGGRPAAEAMYDRSKQQSVWFYVAGG